MWPFAQKRFLDPVDEDWQFATWRAFLMRFGGVADLKSSSLILPNAAFFPPTDAQGHARVEHIFAQVKALAGLSEWHCQLVAQPERPERKVGDFLHVQIESDETPLGTFAVEGNEVVITYDPASMADPVTLIATLIHELSHYMIASALPDIYQDEETHEFATDLLTVYLGFGLFGANRAFQFKQHGDSFSQGWQYSRQGYLDERAWCFALAIFFCLRGEDHSIAKPFLKSHLYADLQKAFRYLTGPRSGAMNALRAL